VRSSEAARRVNENRRDDEFHHVHRPWRSGGSDADVFNSIYEGRAKGMPAWGTVLSHKQIWELVSYIRSLGGMTGRRIPTLVNANSAQAGGPTPQNRRQP
jgi:hypothetical protein